MTCDRCPLKEIPDTKGPFTCFCGKQLTDRTIDRRDPLPRITVQTKHADLLPRFVQERVMVCAGCSRRRGEACEEVATATRAGKIMHARGARDFSRRCPVDKWERTTREGEVPLGVRVLVEQIRSNGEPRGDVLLVVTHFNPSRFHRLADTYRRWVPTLGRLGIHIQPIEIAYGNEPAEVPGANVIRANRSASVLWQKEAIVNRALKRAPKHVRYFGWLDHDLAFDNPDWLTDAIAKIDAGATAVQLFDSVAFLNADDQVINNRRGAVANGGSGSPGGAWLADRDYMDRIGGLEWSSVVGGGDQTFCLGSMGIRPSAFARYSPKHREHCERYAEGLKGSSPSFVPGRVYHLYHGSPGNRQHMTRDRILADSEYDPATDVRTNDQGVLEWSSHKPRMHEAVANYFADRREDD